MLHAIDELNTLADLDLGAIVAHLEASGAPTQAEILAEAELRYEPVHQTASRVEVLPVLLVSPLERSALSDETIAIVGRLCAAQHRVDGLRVRGQVAVRLRPASADWRERRQVA